MSTTFGWIIAFALIGASNWEGPGLIIGGVIGLIVGSMISKSQQKAFTERLAAELKPLIDRIAELERRLTQSKQAQPKSDTPVQQAQDQAAVTDVADTPQPITALASVTSEPSVTAVAVEDQSTAVAAQQANQRDNPWEETLSSSDGGFQTPDFINKILHFLTGGNVVVRVGVVLLFIGVAFLIRYAAERSLFPIELRLAAVTVAAIVVCVIGWRLRNRPGHYGLVLQGGSIGVLYLTIYGASKLYGLLPHTLAFVLMAGIVAFSAILAILQNAKALAMFGSAGGFLAPILLSTGGGSHVALFTYYLFLNAGILAIAWYRSWRELNLLGFVFTFVIGTLWGFKYYRPEHLTTTEPFLIAFFLMYVGISILFAVRQPPQLRGYVDGSLVFGVPIVAFGLQAAMVHNYEYAMSISAMAVSAFYIGLAILFWRKAQEGLRLLTEAYLALGVVFGSLAIPLALDGRWTAAAWAMEGAMLVWVGIRQNRRLAQLFGTLLQFAAGAAFLTEIDSPVGGWVLLNSVWMGAVLIAVSALYCGWIFHRHPQSLFSQAGLMSSVLLGWGTLWWLVFGLREINVHLSSLNEMPSVLVFIAGTALLWQWLSRRLQWPLMMMPTMLLLPAMVIVLAVEFALVYLPHAFEGWGLLAWAVAIGAHLRVLWHGESVWPRNIVQLWHPVGLWLIVGLLTWELDWLIRETVFQSWTWHLIAWALVPGIAVYALLRFADRIPWPVAKFSLEYLGLGLGVMAVYLWLWSMAAAHHAGDSNPLPYVILFNPLDIAQCFALLAALRWVFWWRSVETDKERLEYLPKVLAALALGAFVWINAVIARAVHFWGDVSWSIRAMQRSFLFQTTISILWTLIAMVVMIMANRWASRRVWFVGAGLLAVVVVKLLLVDLSGAGNLERIISFLGVGVLMLVIGFYSPLPPRQREEASS